MKVKENTKIIQKFIMILGKTDDEKSGQKAKHLSLANKVHFLSVFVFYLTHFDRKIFCTLETTLQFRYQVTPFQIN